MNNNELTIYNSSDLNSNMSADLNNIVKLNNIIFTKLVKTNSLIEYVNGINIYIN